MKATLSHIFALATLLAPVTLAANNDLDYYLPPGEVVWLGEGDTRVLLLEQENKQAFDRGSILHIPEWGYHPYQSSAIRSLYQNMPDYGWQSYALQPPTQPLDNFRWQTDEDVRYPDPVADEELAKLRAQLRERVELAYAQTSLIAGSFIIVAEGISAALLTDLFSSNELPLPDAFVVYGIYFPQWQLNQQLATSLAQLPVPVLDLSPRDGNDWVTQAASRRQQQAQRHQQINYRQRIIPGGTHAQQPRYLQHQLYGWLRHNDF